MSTRFTLPISPNYVSHWGLWEAIRELIQNAFDERTRDSDCRVAVNFENRTVRIYSSTGTLKPESLILGNTTKSDDLAQRGKFGEGYKLALLVLTRLGHKVKVRNGEKLWVPKIEVDEEFNAQVLRIYVEDLDLPEKGVAFIVPDVSEEQWAVIKQNLCDVRDRDEILPEPEEKGRVYVGGLFVATMKDFECGYALAPGTIKLDRDRGMLDGFDLSYVTSRLWARQTESQRAYELIKDEAPDVTYLESHASAKDAVVETVKNRFFADHGADAIPVSTQHEVERATTAGVKWVLVPEVLKRLVGKVCRIFIPSKDTPMARLRRFLDENRYALSDEARHELTDIIAAMDPFQTTELAA